MMHTANLSKSRNICLIIYVIKAWLANLSLSLGFNKDMSQSQSTKKIGLWTSASLVIGNMIGVGVFMMPAVMASFGTVSLLGWLFAAIGSYFLAKVFANLSKLLPGVTGGPYAYAHKGLGDFAGFLTAWG